jgi:hypothetical protein
MQGNQHKTMKVWGWIAAFLFAPVGIVLGLVLRKRGQPVGTWIAAVSAVVCVIAVASAAGGSDTTSNPTSSTSGTTKTNADATETPEQKLEPVVLHASDRTVHSDRVTLTGTVEPATANVSVSGRNAKVRHGHFSVVVDSLSIGDNDATVSAAAKGMEPAEQDVTITRKRSHAELLALARARIERKRRAARRRREAALRRAYGRAIDSAESYLAFKGFSKQGLYEQLSSPAGEGFTEAEARYAVEHVHANWKKEAVEAAKSYLEFKSFSRQGLYEQLVSDAGEGFTPEEAQYAVNKVY